MIIGFLNKSSEVEELSLLRGGVVFLLIASENTLNAIIQLCVCVW